MQTRNELLRVYDTLRLNLVDVGFEHGLEGGAEGFLGELIVGQDLLHFDYGDTATALSISFLQRVVQLECLLVHFRDIHGVQEYPILNSARLFRVELLAYDCELTR